MRFAAPVDARHQHACINYRQAHARRTLRKARFTIVAASFEERALAAGWLKRAATSSGEGGFTGRTNNPASPKSNTFSGPPRSRPTRRHQFSGKTVCRLRVKVIVVTFIGNILLPQRAGA